MILEWIGDALLSGRAPGRRVPAARRAARRQQHRAERRAIAVAAARPGRRTSTPRPLLLTTQDQVNKTVETAADYGGSLDMILDDAMRRR